MIVIFPETSVDFARIDGNILLRWGIGGHGGDTSEGGGEGQPVTLSELATGFPPQIDNFMDTRFFSGSRRDPSGAGRWNGRPAAGRVQTRGEFSPINYFCTICFLIQTHADEEWNRMVEGDDDEENSVSSVRIPMDN